MSWIVFGAHFQCRHIFLETYRKKTTNTNRAVKSTVRKYHVLSAFARPSAHSNHLYLYYLPLYHETGYSAPWWFQIKASHK